MVDLDDPDVVGVADPPEGPDEVPRLDGQAGRVSARFLREDRAADGDTSGAQKPVAECLKELPGHHDFIDFAVGISADLAPRAREITGSQGWLTPPWREVAEFHGRSPRPPAIGP